MQAAGGKQSKGMHSRKIVLSLCRTSAYPKDSLAKPYMQKVGISPCSMTDTAIRLHKAAATVLLACCPLFVGSAPFDKMQRPVAIAVLCGKVCAALLCTGLFADPLHIPSVQD